MANSANTVDHIFGDVPAFETLGGGIFDVMLHAVTFMGEDVAIENEEETKNEDDEPCANCKKSRHIHTGSHYCCDYTTCIGPCDNCKNAKRPVIYCCDYTTRIGNDCLNSKIIIGGVDFKDVLDRIKAIERYIAAREIERQTSLPSDIAQMITQYF